MTRNAPNQPFECFTAHAGAQVHPRVCPEEWRREKREEKKRAARRLRRFSAALAVVLVVAVGAGAVAVWLGGKAKERQVSFLEEQGRRTLVDEGDAQRAVVYLSEAYKEQPNRPITRFLLARAMALGIDAEIAILRGHEGPVYSAAFSPDGTCVVTASFDQTARLWEARTGALLATLNDFEDTVRSAAFSPDGARVVTASSDKTARIWDVHLETRPPGEIARLVRCKIPFRLADGVLVPAEPDLSACPSPPVK